MADLTLDDIRAACVAAGLPGAEVEAVEWSGWPEAIACVTTPQRWLTFYGLTVLRSGLAAPFGHEEKMAALADALATMARVMAERRGALASALAEVDRVLGRVPEGAAAEAVSTIDRLEAIGDGWGGRPR